MRSLTVALIRLAAMIVAIIASFGEGCRRLFSREKGPPPDLPPPVSLGEIEATIRRNEGEEAAVKELRELLEGKPWRIRCRCGIQSVAIDGPKHEAVAQSARTSGFREIAPEQYVCRRCFPKWQELQKQLVEAHA